MPISRPPLTQEEIRKRQRLLEDRKTFHANAPVTRRELLPIVVAIRNIQQQLNITPLLRLKIALPPDLGDDDFTG